MQETSEDGEIGYAYRGLRTHRRSTDSRSGGPRWRHRLAVSASLRFRVVLRRPGRGRTARPLEPVPGRRGAGQCSPLPSGDAGARIGFRDRRRHGAHHRLHAAARRRSTPGDANRPRCARPGADEDGTGDSPRLRDHCPVGGAGTGRNPRHRRTGRLPPLHTRAPADQTRGRSAPGSSSPRVAVPGSLCAGTPPSKTRRRWRTPTRRWPAPRRGGESGVGAACTRAPTAIRC